MDHKERNLEQQHLADLLLTLNNTLKDTRAEEAELEIKVAELYDEYRMGKGELYDTLVVHRHILEQVKQELEHHQLALNKPYFGRIDYLDKQEKKNYCLYIGKHGLTKDTTEILVVDWRAPAATIYYDCSLGDDSYQVEERVYPIRLDLKRTLEINDGTLTSFYDSEAVTDDALLIQYLSQNKEAVLGDIITTIQKEQNEIIRRPPFHNLIVQGAAGSGKTTVALHRISYLFYNYGERYKPSEFCILGSSNILLNYITSGLPDLDVHDIRSMPMADFFTSILEEDLTSYVYQTDIFLSYKTTYAFADSLKQFLEQIERRILPYKDIEGDLGIYMSETFIRDILRTIPHNSLSEKTKLLNEHLSKRIALVLHREKKTVINEQRKKFRNLFLNIYDKTPLTDIYIEFLYHLSDAGHIDELSFGKWHENIRAGHYDLYDLCALSYIKYKIHGIIEAEELSQIFIDEAQDFGASLYYLLKEMMYDSRFTIMGDISQNIRDNTGLDDWDALTEQIFSDEKSYFFKLMKSYRNTIEISNFANEILDRSSLSRYPVEPIIRHGIPVQIKSTSTEQQLVELYIHQLKRLQQKDYQTIAIITHNPEEAERIRPFFADTFTLCPAMGETQQFQNGIQIIPLTYVKGLEFDVVFLWNANNTNYSAENSDAKRLYVAATRALHELYVYYTGTPAALLPITCA